MMSPDPQSIAIDMACSEAVGWLVEQLSRAGLSVVRTFDLQAARRAQIACRCPHHGTESCDCQMVVLLVYQAPHRPVTLIAHGYNGQTWFSVVNTPEQRPDTRLEAAIRLCLAAPVLVSKMTRAMHVVPNQG